MVLGVGLLGAGPVTQAIHLPTLARLPDLFRAVHVMDVDADVAASVADRAGARSSTSAARLLSDPEVDVVLVGSPNRFHAEQVIAACRAGKRAVLCEKPLAVTAEEASEIGRVASKTGVPVMVGAMHTYDPSWRAVAQAWGDLPDAVHTIRSGIVLAPNARFEEFASQIITRPPETDPDVEDPAAVAAHLHGITMGLAIHDLPLVRAFCPQVAGLEVTAAAAPPSGGYLIDVQAGDRHVHLQAVKTRGWRPEWWFEAISDDRALRIDFPPPYVHARSGRAVLRRRDRELGFGPYPANGYEAEWRHLAAVVEGREEYAGVSGVVDDVVFAIAIAEQAAALGARTVSARREWTR